MDQSKGAGLTRYPSHRNLKFMRRLMFGSVLALSVIRSGVSLAQAVPARDLLEFPIGTVAEAPVLATISGDGLWNPASIFLRNGSRLRVTAGALHGPAAQGVTAQLLAAAVRVGERTTAGLAISRASVADLIRTENDPQSIGGEIPYSTIVVSAAVARRTHRYVTAAAALRYRHGEMDRDRRGALGLDGGVVADAFPWRDARIAASTFLWRPGNTGEERTRFSLGGDLRVVGVDSLEAVRVGYAAAITQRISRDQYAFVAGRWRAVEMRGGALYLSAHGNDEWRFRIGVGLHHARYVVGLAREDTGAGLAPMYAFTLTTIFP
jgi:hypothetical protein